MERNSESRIEILNEYANTACVENFNGEWFLCAKEVLKNNSINLYFYAEAIRQCLKNGHQKQNNIMLVGPTNCGKSFLLNPLELIHKHSCTHQLHLMHGLGWKNAKLPTSMIFVTLRNA